MNNSALNYSFLNCTKEVIYCLEKAKRIAIVKNSTSIKPIHLCISLIFNSKLIQKILNINYFKLDKKILLDKIFNCKNKTIEKSKYKKFPSFSIDKNILMTFNILNGLKYPFNTLLLFYYQWKQNPTIYSFVFSILNLQKINYIGNLLKDYTTNFSLKLNIPEELKGILTILKGNNNILGREKESKEIIEILAQKTNRNIILLGEHGIGKLSIISKIITLLPNKTFLELNLTNLMSMAQRHTDLINFLFDFLKKQKNIVIYCKNFNLLFDSSSLDIVYIKYTIYEMLHNNFFQFIGTSSIDTYNKTMKDDEWLKFIFSKVNIAEPNKYTLLLIMKQYLTSNNIYIDDATIETIIDLSSKFINNYVFPKKGLLILDYIINKYKKVHKKLTLTRQQILTIISKYSELPTTLILKEHSMEANINNIDTNLKKYVFGQNLAVTKIAASLKRAYTGLKDKNKPIGSWLLCGPSGTGKTELVKSLAYLLFGSEKELIRFDMSEFMEKHSISKLIGPPPGYVGSEEGGLLTEAVKKKPYSVILFDEIEKAHKDINNIMLQLLDEGRLTDSKGQHIDFTNTLIIYTSNLGCPTSPIQFKSFKDGVELSDIEYKSLSKNVDIAVKNFFRPEFLNRLDSVIVFKPLSILCLTNIVDKFLSNILIKLKENNIPLEIEVDEEIKKLLAKLAYHPLYGARPLKRIIEQFIEKPISELILNFKLKANHIFLIFKDIKKGNINYLIKKF